MSASSKRQVAALCVVVALVAAALTIESPHWNASRHGHLSSSLPDVRPVFYQQGGNGQQVLVARFPVQNAGFQNSTLWKPQELPIVYSTNEFIFSLVKALVGVRPPGPLAASDAAQAGQWGELRFRVTTQGTTRPVG